MAGSTGQLSHGLQSCATYLALMPRLGIGFLSPKTKNKTKT